MRMINNGKQQCRHRVYGERDQVRGEGTWPKKTTTKSMKSTAYNFWRRNNVDDYFIAFCVIRILIANQYGKSWYDSRSKTSADKDKAGIQMDGS